MSAVLICACCACSKSIQIQRPTARAQQVAVAEDGTLQITLSGTDPDDGAMAVYEVITQPAYGTLSGSGATRTYRPSVDFHGDDSLRFAVADDDGALSAAATIRITVTPVNDPPVADAGGDQSVGTGSTVTVIGRGTDVDNEGADLTFAWSQHAASSESAPALDLTPADGAELTFTAPSVAAVYTLQLLVSDPSGARSSDSVRITIGAIGTTNQTPVAHEQQVSVAEDATLQITLGGNDPDGTVVGYEVITQPAHGTLSGSGATRTYRPSVDFYGDDSLRFAVADDDGALSAAATISITVTPVNDPPVADAGGNQLVSPGATVTVIGSGTDADETDAVLSYAWSQLSAAPAGAPALDLTPADGALLTFSAPDRETVTAYTLQLVVTDYGHSSASDTVKITVSNRTAPQTNLIVRGVIDGVNVSVYDGIGFDEGQHGARITETFEAHTTNASLTQILGVPKNSNNYTNHVVRHNDGIFWTATDSSPLYTPGRTSWFIEDDRPFTKHAKDFATWMQHQNALYVSSLENPLRDENGNALYCDDVQDPSYFRPLCGEMDDYIAHSGTGVENTIFVASLGFTASRLPFAAATIRADGVFAAEAVYAPVRITTESTSANTSHSTAVVAAIATDIAATLAVRYHRVPTAAEIKTELFSQAAMKLIPHWESTEDRCLRVIGVDQSTLNSMRSCTE